MRLSPETIYRALYVQSRGTLRRELTQHLRTRRTKRQARGSSRSGQGRGQITDKVMISERPADVEDRAVPGHWEGDLLMGNKMTAIATLVERQTRYTQLVALPDGFRAEPVRQALADSIATLPEQLRRSLTWDQGKERPKHKQFTIDSGLLVYFCDPRSPECGHLKWPRCGRLNWPHLRPIAAWTVASSSSSSGRGRKGWVPGWRRSSRSGAIAIARGCRSGRWRRVMGCIAGR